MKYSGIGGQAVIEGIMMRNKDKYSVGVRKPDGEIVIDVKEFKPYAERFKLAGVPFIRGSFAFVESMVIGMRTLMYSASFFEDDEDCEPSKFEMWLEKTFGDKLDKIIIGISMAAAFVLALVIFLWLPLFLAGLLNRVITNDTLMAFFEGVIRVAIFVIYIKLVSKTKDINRTFMYHGAEHKCINCIEHGLPLSVDNVAVSSKEHKRCGTSFIIIVMLIGILFFMVIRVHDPIMRLLSRIVLMPVIAGVSYEFLRLAGRSENPIVNILSKPGLMMQKLTTYEPDDSMIEVAIAAVEAVFDWKEYQKKEFPNGPDELGRTLIEAAKVRKKA
ncbi:MAG: DUF1385 domain-containing protein [Lachnospiraceae bacterium]|nr:DUF1385 domain-containing protein [Lachnospiraceae bacterium]